MQREKVIVLRDVTVWLGLKGSTREIIEQIDTEFQTVFIYSPVSFIIQRTKRFIMQSSTENCHFDGVQGTSSFDPL